MNAITKRTWTGLAVAGALFATQANAADCGPQAGMTSSEYTITPLDNTVQLSSSDSQLIGVANPDGSLSVFQLVPFVVVPDASARNEQAFGPTYLSSLQVDPYSDVLVVMPSNQ
jgi:hypothetical protein